MSVVVLDEIGLAEESPSLPLQTLHFLLEDGATKAQNVSLDIVIIFLSGEYVYVSTLT